MNLQKFILLFSIICFNFLSCQKNSISVAKNEFKLTKNQFNTFENNMKSIPLTIRYFDEDNSRYVDFDIKNRSVKFIKNWNFANPQPNTIYGSGSGLVIYISSSNTAWGYGTPTHSITAGNTTLNVQTLCLAVDCSAYAAMFASQIGQLPYDGISCVMGLDADFSLLANSSNTNFSNYFSGLAYYLVYDFQANGNYDVIDWTSWTGNFPSSLGYAMVFSFDANNFGTFYFSKSGDINVSGGDMTFNGDYWGIENNFSYINPNLTYSIYPGSGTMGCN